MAKPFRGTLNLDIRDSKPDWSAFLADKAPNDAPNVLVILYDDTGWRPGRHSAAGSTCPHSSASPTTGSCIRSGTRPPCVRPPAPAS